MFGLFIFEYMWKKCAQYRVANDKIHNKFPMFKRMDEPWKWSRWTFYPGAMLVMPTRTFIVLGSVAFFGCLAGLLSMGHDFKKGPLTGTRRTVVHQLLRFGCEIIVVVSGMNVTLRYMRADYTEYLGEHYKSNMKEIKRTSTVVANHVSWLDGFMFYAKLMPAMAVD